jgi:hypothetical protein
MEIVEAINETRTEPYGIVVLLYNGVAVASCPECGWCKPTIANRRKRWTTIDRAAFGLQLHAIAKHQYKSPYVFRHWI